MGRYEEYGQGRHEKHKENPESWMSDIELVVLLLETAEEGFDEQM